MTAAASFTGSPPGWSDGLGASEIDADFTDAEYGQMLEEVRGYLPLFLSAAATDHPNPAGGLEPLTALDDRDLTRVVAVHLCLEDAVTSFARELPRGLRRPLTATERPVLVTQAVHGPIDWASTIRRRSLTGWDPSVFVVRPSQRVFDTPENRALAWALQRLRVAHGRASRATDSPGEPDTWQSGLSALSAVLDRSVRVEWLRGIVPERPTPRVRQRLAAARHGFYRRHLAQVVGLLLAAENPSKEDLIEALCRRYFRPDKAWRLFEVLVALRLTRELAETKYPTAITKSRLLAGGKGVRAYATYALPDGGSIELLYQRWPTTKVPSKRQDAAKRHGFTPRPSAPDLMVARLDASGALADAVILELKATRSQGYLASGFSQLLGYLGERPALFGNEPAGWLVAPTSDAFIVAEPESGETLWLTTAENVAQEVAERMTA